MDLHTSMTSLNGFTDIEYKILSAPPRPFHGHAKKVSIVYYNLIHK